MAVSYAPSPRPEALRIVPYRPFVREDESGERAPGSVVTMPTMPEAPAGGGLTLSLLRAASLLSIWSVHDASCAAKRVRYPKKRVVPRGDTDTHVRMR